MDRGTEGFGFVDRRRKGRNRRGNRNSLCKMAMSALENEERATNFSEFHGFGAKRAFGIGEGEEFMFFGRRKSKGIMTLFTKELLVAIFVMTISVNGRATFRAGRHLHSEHLLCG